MNIKDFPITLKAEDVAKIMGVARSTAYSYMREPGFPSFKMRGKRGALRVNRDSLYAWMIEQSAGDHSA